MTLIPASQCVLSTLSHVPLSGGQSSPYSHRLLRVVGGHRSHIWQCICASVTRRGVRAGRN